LTQEFDNDLTYRVFRLICGGPDERRLHEAFSSRPVPDGCLDTEPENILRRTSAPYHPQSMGLVERAHQTIQTILSKMSFTRRHWDLFLPFAQYSYNVVPRAMFKGLCSFEMIYGYLPGDNRFDQLDSSIPQLLGDEIIEYAERKREVLEAMCGIIEEDPIGINDGINRCSLGLELLTMFL